jgi:hypothetical protein
MGVSIGRGRRSRREEEEGEEKGQERSRSKSSLLSDPTYLRGLEEPSGGSLDLGIYPFPFPPSLVSSPEPGADLHPSSLPHFFPSPLSYISTTSPLTISFILLASILLLLIHCGRVPGMHNIFRRRIPSAFDVNAQSFHPFSLSSPRQRKFPRVHYINTMFDADQAEAAAAGGKRGPGEGPSQRTPLLG